MNTAELIAFAQDPKNEGVKLKNNILNRYEHIIKDKWIFIIVHDNNDILEPMSAYYYFSNNAEWSIAPHEVPALEAIKAYHNGIAVECHIDNNVFRYEPNDKLSGSFGYDLKDEEDIVITTGEILNGEWYITGDKND